MGQFLRNLIYVVLMASLMLIICSCKNEIDLVEISVDESIQGVVEEVLQSRLCLADGNIEGAAAVVMDINDNSVKAVVNMKLDSAGRLGSPYNYVFNEQIEPGGLFLAATLASLLEDKCVNMDTEVDAGNGKWSANGRTYIDSEPLGKIAVGDAFYNSSNIAFAKMSKEYYADSPQKFVDNVKGYFSAQYMDTDVPSPIFADPTDDSWHDSQLTSMAIGYNVMVTPVQLATFYNAIANGGGSVLPKDVAKEMMGLFRRDSAKILADKAVARIMISPSVGYEENGLRRYQSSICGYFPVDNPKYTLLVIVFYRDVPGAEVIGEFASTAFDDAVCRIVAK